MNTPVPVAPPPPSEIQGVVDNIAAGRVYGWAWNPSRPEERVAIELRLGQMTVAQTIAAQERADLKGAGVGDGRHAFELRLTPELVERRAEIFIVARAADGLEVPLPILGARRPLALVPPTPGGQNAQSLVRSVQALAGAQRDLSEKLASLAVRVPEASATADELAARIATLEGWCLRIDERLATLPGPAPAPAARRRLDPWQMALGALTVSAVAGGVILAWIGAFPAAGVP
jgi:hypothetical protein